MLETSREYLSPDGQLRFRVVRSGDGDVSLGFAGTPSHTHGDILAAESGLPVDRAIHDFVEGLLGSKTVIAISTVDGKIRDIWTTKDPSADLRYCQQNEKILFRLWGGRIVSANSRSQP